MTDAHSKHEPDLSDDDAQADEQPPDSSIEATPATAGATDLSPVFGGKAQPQAIVDTELGNAQSDEGPKKESTTTNFDPENDARVQPVEADEEAET